MSVDTLAARSGLSQGEAAALLEEVGPNSLPQESKETLLQRLLRQFKNPLIYILLFALVFDVAVWLWEASGDTPFEAITIAVILIANAVLGVWQESKSEAALEKLASLAAPSAWVLRDGRLQQVPATTVVPGDVLRLEAGERIPADAELLNSGAILVDESILTGESLPVDKEAGDTISAGTLVVRGHCFARVTATGADSSMGQLAGLMAYVDAEPTPLEKRMTVFGRKVAVLVVFLAAVIFAAGLAYTGLSFVNQILLFAIALAVAAVPESLPAALTLALTLGVERMAGRKAVVRRLAAVEALGSVTVIATDKTGTLTENAMRVESIVGDEQGLLRAMALVNDADPETGAGDPLETGLLAYVDRQADSRAIRDEYRRVDVTPFDAAWKYMRVSVESEGVTLSYLKGAPEVVLARCTMEAGQRRTIEQQIADSAAQGYRVLAFAQGEGADEEGLQWLGIALLWDPPRQEVPDAIRRAQQAGVRVLMVTGDHPATATAIAAHIGIEDPRTCSGDDVQACDEQQLRALVKHHDVFARVSPEHKLRIVRALKANDETVAVTGDGVNDAPALKAADVGVAMGQRGSDVSREVADLVLLDDNFSTIVAAIEEGRSIFENIQKFIRTLFSTNLSEVTLISVGALLAFATFSAGDAHLVLPLTAAQILWINLLTDSLPALALSTDRNPAAMGEPPRGAATPLLDARSLWFVMLVGLLGALAAVLLLLLLPGFGREPELAQSMVFHFLVFVQLSFVLPARRVRWWPGTNPLVFAAIAVVLALQVAVLLWPQLATMLLAQPLAVADLTLVLAGVAICWCAAELVAWRLRRRAPTV